MPEQSAVFAGGALAKAVAGDRAMPFAFVAAAKRLRGVTAYVDRAGAISKGDEIAVRVRSSGSGQARRSASAPA